MGWHRMASANVHGLRPVDSNVQHKSNSLPAETVCLVVSNVFSLSPFVTMIGIGYVSHSFSCFSPVQHGQMNKWIYRQVSKILHSQGISVQGGTISRGSFGQLVDKERDATKTRKNKLFGTEIGLTFPDQDWWWVTKLWILPNTTGIFTSKVKSNWITRGVLYKTNNLKHRIASQHLEVFLTVNINQLSPSISFLPPDSYCQFIWRCRSKEPPSWDNTGIHWMPKIGSKLQISLFSRSPHKKVCGRCYKPNWRSTSGAWHGEFAPRHLAVTRMGSEGVAILEDVHMQFCRLKSTSCFDMKAKFGSVWSGVSSFNS